MTTLHTFGCSITQGFSLPDVIKPLTDDQGRVLTDEEVLALGDNFDWNTVHIYEPSDYAWPSILAKKLDIPVQNYARRGACFQQISRQCAVEAKNIKPHDIVIVMWTYLSRISMQWPARTSVPFCNIIEPNWGWRSVLLPGFNKFFGLDRSDKSTDDIDNRIYQYIQDSAKYTYLDPLGVYNRYYNNLLLQQMTHGFLSATGARIIHLSVELETYKEQLENARQELDVSLKDPYVIPHPDEWHSIEVDHSCCPVIFDSRIPLSVNDMHPSVTHHSIFADYINEKYFQNSNEE